MKKPLIVLTGPTAVGKTKLSISLAKAVGGEIISADSMQVYKYMDIGSAKIMPEEMQGVPHYLVDALMPDEEFHIVRFQQMAKEAMEKIYANGHIPILVGGTGFYIQAVTRDIDFTQAEQDDGYRASLEALAQEKGVAYLHQMLAKVDPKSAEEIHENNVKRVIRALEFYHQNGSPISAHNEEQQERVSPYNLAYLDREMPLEEAVRILKRDTRHFAKRQLTWFRRELETLWINKDEFGYDDGKMLEYMLSICREKGILG